MNISVQRVIGLLFIVVIILYISFLIVHPSTKENIRFATAANPTHLIGGFSAGHSPSIDASVGLNAILDYGYNPVVGDSKSTALKASNLNIIDQMPDEYLRQYNSDGNLQNLLSSLTNHLQSVQNNSQIVAYWVLDDWKNDGSAKTALQQMNALIHQYTPGKPSICGFSGNSGNYAGKTKNFSPTGCDMVGLYIYPQSPSEFSLPTILPALEDGLKAQGWDITTNPLVGVPLSYGGANGYSVPTASQVETETKAFCTAGATGIIYYDFDTGTNASNDSGIQQGIKAGLADCEAMWGNSNNISPTISIAPTVSVPAVSATVTPTVSSTHVTNFSLSLCPHGLGSCGDNANPSGGNASPKHTQRAAMLTVFDTNNQQVGQGEGLLTYNPSTQKMEGTIAVLNLTAGNYLVTIRMDGFLAEKYPGFQTITPGQTMTLPSIAAVNGDINNDNQLDILDYNLLIGCYGSKATTSSCTAASSAASPGSDINDDGTIDGGDYNLFLREMSVQKGV